MVAWYNVPKDKLSIFHRGRYVNHTEMLHWKHGGYYLKRNSRIVGGRTVRVLASVYGSYWYKNQYFWHGWKPCTGKVLHMDKAESATWEVPKGYAWSGIFTNWAIGVYFDPDTSTFITLGDLYKSLPAR